MRSATPEDVSGLSGRTSLVKRNLRWKTMTSGWRHISPGVQVSTRSVTS